MSTAAGGQVQGASTGRHAHGPAAGRQARRPVAARRFLGAVAVVVLAVAMVLPGLPGLPVPPAVGQEALPGDGLMIVLDSSGSMVADAGNGQTRIEAAKDAVAALVEVLPDGINVGLTVYGHRVGSDDDLREQGCQDIETVVDVAPLDRDALTGALGGFEPSGYTPIGAALESAAADLEAVTGRATIVLVSDGIDTCAPPPACDVAAALRDDGRDITVETVGFQVDEAARAELECIAEATGGSYRDAPDAASLAEGIQALSSRSFRAYLPAGDEITGGGSAADATALPLGNHVDSLSPGTDRWYSFDIPAGQDFFLTSTLVGQRDDPLAEPRTLDMEVYAAPFEDEADPCGRWTAEVDDGTKPVSAAVGGGVTREDGCTTGSFVAKVGLSEPDEDATYPLELVLFLTPPNDELVPPGFDSTPVSAADTPVGGASYSLAPLVAPGTYSDSIRAGERQIWAVPVPRDATVSATLELPGVEVPETAETTATLQLENGARQGDPEEADDAVQQAAVQTLSGGEVTLTSAPIAADPREWLRLPGVYFVNVTVDNASVPAGLFDYELTLAVEAPVEPTATPTPTATATSSPTPTSTPTTTVTPTASAEVPDDSSTIPMTAWILIGLAVLVVGGGLITFVLRQNR